MQKNLKNVFDTLNFLLFLCRGSVANDLSYHVQQSTN